MQTKPRPRAPKSLVAAAVICVVCTGGTAQALTLLDPLTLTKFVDPLPNQLGNVLSPDGTLDGATFYQVEMTQFTQQLHSQIPATTVWGYNGTFPGPTFEVRRGEFVKVDWINNLRDGSGN